MTNIKTKKAGLILNANKTRDKIEEYYSNFKIKNSTASKKSSNKKSTNKKSKKKSEKKSKTKNVNKPIFRGGARTNNLLTSIIEQLIILILSGSIKGVTLDKETELKILRRTKIIDFIKGNNSFDIMFYKAIKCYDSGIDYSNKNIMTESDINKILKKYLPDDIILTAEAIMFIKYITYYSLNTCIRILSVIRQSSSGKSIILPQIINCVRLFIPDGELFKKIKEEADVCVEKVEKYENYIKEKQKKKKSSDSDSDSDDSSSEDDSESSDSSSEDSDDSSDDD